MTSIDCPNARLPTSCAQPLKKQGQFAALEL